MEITTFNPQILTKDAESLAAFFEELGFERRHDRKFVDKHAVHAIRMKDASGFYLDISQSEGYELADMVGIRMNVRDFKEAYEYLISKGYENVYGNDTVITDSSESAFLIAPTKGYAINLVKHIRK